MEKENTFGAFEALVDMIHGKQGYTEVDNIKDPSDFKGTKDDSGFEDDPDMEVEIRDTDETEQETTVIPVKSKQTVKEEEVEKEEEIEIEDSTIVEETTNTSELSEAEPEIAAFVQEKIFEKLGWEFGEEDKKLQSIDEIVDYVQNLVEENSKPDYASDEIAELNDFVLNGGSIRNYFDTKYAGDFDVETADLENPIVQERIVRELFKEQGHAEDKIAKRLKRYEETGVLEEEAKEAQELLIKSKTKKAEKLLVEQQNLRMEAEKQNKIFYDNVTSSIKTLKDVRGIELSTAEKTKLIDYIFKLESDGKTKYQKEYQKSTNNLIESAYFTMMKDTLVKKIQNKATSEATQSLKKKLQSVKTGNRMKASIENTSITNKKGDTTGFNVLESFLKKPKE